VIAGDVISIRVESGAMVARQSGAVEVTGIQDAVVLALEDSEDAPDERKQADGIPLPEAGCYELLR
jgi:hypothetical protein